MSSIKNWGLGLVVLLSAGAAGMDAGTVGQGVSQWVYPGRDGKLVYKTTDAGDRIMDFSQAGYMGGGVPLPDVAVVKTVEPLGNGKDDTAAIQAAVDAVGKMAVKDGFRGAVLLAPGTFTCGRTISMPASGVVLRGSGSGEGGTTIKMVGARHGAIVIGRGRGYVPPPDDNQPDAAEQPATRDFSAAQTSIADAYVPAGATTFGLADTKGIAVGDTINIRRPTTPAWVKLMGMDNLRRDGKAQTWIGTGRSGNEVRKIIAVSGNSVTVNIPLADSYDAKYLGSNGTKVTKVRDASPVTQVGVEHLHIQCPPLETAYGQAPYSAVRVEGDDCWVRDVYCQETMNSTTEGGRRITMEQVVVTHTYPNLGASKPTDFSIEGSQILVDRCKITGDNMYFVWTGSLEPGPNVLLNCTFVGRGSRIQPHMRWSTGLLVDNCTIPGGGIDFPNRGVAGSGHGWTMGWGVAWNCVAATYVIQNPPGAMNWAIGCIGTPVDTARYFDSAPILPGGAFDSLGTPVAPQSLYLAQLAERLGPEALRNIGYADNSPGEFPDKSMSPLTPWPVDVDPVLGPDLALHRPINANSIRGDTREFEGEKAVDGDESTYWTMNDDIPFARLELDMEGPVEINAADIREAKGMIGRVQEYTIEAEVNSDWKLLAQGTTVGDDTVVRFPKVTAWKVRLNILKAPATPGIRKFGLYLDKVSPPELFKPATRPAEAR